VKEYRENIYFNVMCGMNYIFENYFDGMKEIIKPLTDDQREVLEDISKNKFFKVTTVKDDEKENFYDNLQVKIIEELGIKVYFDENNKPYVLTHELAEIVGKESKIVMRDIRVLIKEIGEYNFVPSSQSTNFTMVEDTYINSQNKEQPTYRLYKDLMLKYILGMKGKKFGEFQLKYIDAFNYIEQEYQKLLIENAKLKESFYKMYNEIRIRNRDLLVDDFNKRVKTKKKAS
jgi:Rha family phage regulatory protein